MAVSEVGLQEGSLRSGELQGGFRGAPRLTQPTHGSAGHDAQLQAGQPAQVVHHQHHGSTCKAVSRVKPPPHLLGRAGGAPGGLRGHPGGLTAAQGQVGGVGRVCHVRQHRLHCLVRRHHLAKVQGTVRPGQGDRERSGVRGRCSPSSCGHRPRRGSLQGQSSVTPRWHPGARGPRARQQPGTGGRRRGSSSPSPSSISSSASWKVGLEPGTLHGDRLSPRVPAGGGEKEGCMPHLGAGGGHADSHTGRQECRRAPATLRARGVPGSG